MTLSCYCDFDSEDADWFYTVANNFSVLDTKRSRKCCSCKTKINPGDTALEVYRNRSPSDRCNYIEESIYGDEVPLASWYMCEACGGLHFAVEDLGMCYAIGESIKDQIREFRAEEKYFAEKEKARIAKEPKV